MPITRNADGRRVLLTGATGYVGGLLGLAYWYGVYPLHALVFAGMLRGIAGRAVRDGDRAAMKDPAKMHAGGPKA